MLHGVPSLGVFPTVPPPRRPRWAAGGRRFSIGSCSWWVLGLLGCARVADLRNQDRMDLTRTIASLKANAKHYAQTHDQHAHHGLGHMLEELYDVLDTGPARMIYSQMLRVQTGFGLKALAKIYQKSGHTALHSRAEAFLLDFSTWSCWRKLCFWYSMQCRWVSWQVI